MAVSAAIDCIDDGGEKERQSHSGPQNVELTIDVKCEQASDDDQTVKDTVKSCSGLEDPPVCGWGGIIISASFTVLFIVIGNLWACGVLFAILLDEFGASRGDTALIGAFSYGAMLTTNSLQGRLQRSLSVRLICAIGAVVSAVSMFLSSVATKYWHLYPTLFLFGIGQGLSFPVAFTIVGVWFKQRRALASSFASSGASAGAIMFGLVLRPLQQSFGVRWAFMFLALLQLLGIGSSSLILRKPDPAARCKGDQKVPNPEAIGKSSTTETQSGKSSNKSTSSVWSCPGFGLLALGTWSLSLGFWVPIVHGVRFLEDCGVPQSEADTYTQALGVGGLLGRLPLGMIADRIGPSKMLVFVCLSVGVMDLALHPVGQAVTGIPQTWAAFYGALVGSSMALVPVATIEFVGVERAASGYGITWGLGAALGVSVGPFLAGFTFDLMKSYEVPFITSGCACLLAGAFVMLARRQRHQAREL